MYKTYLISTFLSESAVSAGLNMELMLFQGIQNLQQKFIMSHSEQFVVYQSHDISPISPVSASVEHRNMLISLCFQDISIYSML